MTLSGRMREEIDPSMEFITHEHEEYESARRVWNGSIDKYPICIARCRTVEEVSSCVKYARKYSIPVAVRGGGHSICGFSTIDDGLVIDLGLMRAVQVDDGNKLVSVQGGALWSHVDEATQKFNLATPGGMVSHTGVGGLTLGGGIGWLSRAYGLTCDNLVRAQIVTADGEVLIASENENQDLFWAIRGGGGNFGIITEFTFRLHKVTALEMSLFTYPFSVAQELLEAYFDITRDLPHNISVYLFLAQPFTIVIITYHEGDVTKDKNMEDVGQQYETVVGEFIRLTPEYARVMDPISYCKLQNQFDEGNASGKNYYWKSLFYDQGLNSEAIEELISCVQQAPKTSSIEIMHLGGAIADKSSSDTAFFQRHAKYEMHCMTGWEGDCKTYFSEVRKWAKYYSEVMSQQIGCTKTGYMNTITPMSTELNWIKKSFSSNFDKLARVKCQYDPSNFFNQNHNIQACNMEEARVEETNGASS